MDGVAGVPASAEEIGVLHGTRYGRALVWPGAGVSDPEAHCARKPTAPRAGARPAECSRGLALLRLFGHYTSRPAAISHRFIFV